MRHARNSDTMVPAEVARAGVELRGAPARWPVGLRIAFMVGAALASWGLVLLAGWWLFG